MKLRDSRIGREAVHHRVRLALVVVLLAVAVHAALQLWLDGRAAQARAFDTELSELAAAQRWLSQRVGRLAMTGPEAWITDGDIGLRRTLEHARNDARQLEAMIERIEPQWRDSPLLGQALQGWRHSRDRLWRQGEALLGYARDDGIAQAAALAGQADSAADEALAAAQSLVDALAETTRARHDAQARATRSWYWASVAAFALLAVAVLEPAARSVRRQYRQLGRQARELERLAMVAERTTNLVMITDEQRRIVWVNVAFTRMTGWDMAHAVGATPASLLMADRTGSGAARALLDVASRGEGVRTLVRGRARDGGELWLDLDVQPVRGAGGALAGFVDVAVDVTERRRNQAEMRIAAIAFNSLDAIAVCDSQRRVLKVNPAFTRITGYSEQEVLGDTSGRLLRSLRHDEAFHAAMWQALQTDRHWQGEVWKQRKSGEDYPVWLSLTAVVDEDGEVTHYVAVFSDITQRKQADELIHNLAFYDPLTELPNRRLLRDRLQQTLAGCARTGQCAAVVFIDLDHFKELNDTRGHDIGDRLLVQVAQRLRGCVRAHDTVARQGGDEFVIVLEELGANPEQAAVRAHHLAEKLREAIARPFDLDGHEYRCTASVGVSVLTGADASAEELLKRADTAMYQAKRSGRNAIRFFDPATHAAMQARVALEADLHKAVPERQLELHFQRQAGLAGETIGAEVLLRWHHPLRGAVAPGEFIPVAEESDLIVSIGQWVLEAACRQLAAWHGDPQLGALKLAVNVSARQFRQRDFVERVRAALAQAGADPRHLKLELTESLVLVDVEETAARMQALRQLGVCFAMDDFGTGQSSLAYLSRLPLDQLKIDQSFVCSIGATPNDDIIVQTIIGMARTLGIDVIAEGVETQAQRDFLERSGCRAFQGHLYGRPQPLAQFERAVRDVAV